MSDKPLVFVDTNILLDFYRLRNGEASLCLLGHLDGNHESIITTDQVEMEFMKNRQRVIADSLRSLKEPDWTGVAQIPAFLQEAEPARTIDRHKKTIATQFAKIREKISRVVLEPSKHDPVYKAAQRLFRSAQPFHLGHEKGETLRIRREAVRRFLMGYPPRKPQDTSCGDAVNWEWIIACAKRSSRDVVVVSRDSDYGVWIAKKPALNDWLLQEFRSRVGKNRGIELTDRLSVAFKRFSINVSKEEEESELDLVSPVESGDPLPLWSDGYLQQYQQYAASLVADREHYQQYLASLVALREQHHQSLASMIAPTPQKPEK